MSDAKKSLANINKMIGNIKRSKINQMIHECAMAIIRHAVEYGDHSKMVELKKALPSSIRISDFNTWVVYHTPLNWDIKEGKYKKVKSKDRTWKVEEADATPFWVFTEDKEEIAKPFDPVKAFYAIRTKLKKEMEKGTEIQNLDHWNEIVQKVGEFDD